jgi:imidazoleglycerol-phosphate dehydratase
MSRCATITRRTRETDITATWNLDAAGPAKVATGIGFLDHMLESLGKHSGTTLEVSCHGDLHIDGHHTTEDTGIVLGQALQRALGDSAGIERFGSMTVPLDEAVVACTLDLSGRPHLGYGLDLPVETVGSWSTGLVPEFFTALADHGRCTIHLQQQAGRNTHHIIEAAFKAFARALRQAIRVTGEGVPSTKGVL